MTELWEILVPTQRQDGTPIHTRFHRVWDSKVCAITGGLTVYYPAKGQWVSPEGNVVYDRMIPVRIACTEDQIRFIMQLTLDYYGEEAIFAYRVSDTVLTLTKGGGIVAS